MTASNLWLKAKYTFNHPGKISQISVSVLRKTHSFHSQPQVISGQRMKVRLVPALEDNYMYLLIDETTKQCAAVDPVEPQKILSAVKEEGATLTSILTTHHHWDHANGNEELANHVKGITVYGADKRIGALNNHVGQGTEFKVRCLFTPCHTSGHICYYITGDDDTPAVFTGDTLFVGGCGRFFEGTAEQMYTALVDVLALLPGNTRVYCGHEYTVANLKYALHVEPKNNVVKDKLSWAETQRSQGLPTIPSTIGDELTFNPFMRVREESVQQHTGCHEVMTTMAALREEKNSFRPK